MMMKKMTDDDDDDDDSGDDYNNVSLQSQRERRKWIKGEYDYTNMKTKKQILKVQSSLHYLSGNC